MGFRVANQGETIPAKFDGALRSTYSNNQDYIVDNVGQEFVCTYSSSSLQVSVGTGVACISGRGISSDEVNNITLPANSQIWLCLRIDLTQTTHNEGMLYANTSSSIASDNLSNTNGQHDLLLAVITTNTNGVTGLTDSRNIRSSATKLYSSTGQNQDGAMTQKAVTNAIPVLYSSTGQNTNGAMTQKAVTNILGTQVTYSLSGTTLTITTK